VKTSFVKNHALAILISLIAIGIQWYGQELILLLRYEAVAVNQGEWWRLITANLTHSNGYHLLLNLTGLWMMELLLERDVKASTRALLLGLCMPLTLLLLHLLFNLIWYVGLSGALHGYLIGCALLARKQWPRVYSLVIIGVIAKVIVESIWEINQNTAELIGANVVEESHAMGTVAGLMIALSYIYLPRAMAKIK